MFLNVLWSFTACTSVHVLTWLVLRVSQVKYGTVLWLSSHYICSSYSTGCLLLPPLQRRLKHTLKFSLPVNSRACIQFFFFIIWFFFNYFLDGFDQLSHWMPGEYTMQWRGKPLFYFVKEVRLTSGNTFMSQMLSFVSYHFKGDVLEVLKRR